MKLLSSIECVLVHSNLACLGKALVDGIGTLLTVSSFLVVYSYCYTCNSYYPEVDKRLVRGSPGKGYMIGRYG